MARLQDVAEFVNGRAFKPSDWGGSGLPIIRIANLTDETAPFHHFSGELARRHKVDTGDLLVSWSATLDAFIWNRGPAAVNQHIFKVYERTDLVDRQYLYFAIRNAMAGLRRQVHGATMQHITKPKFEAWPIKLPPLSDQRQIAQRLTLQLKSADSARISLDESLRLVRALPDAAREAAFSPHLTLASAPLGELASGDGQITDGPFGTNLKTAHYTESGVRVIRLQNIGAGEFLSEDSAFISQEHFEGLLRHDARQGDVIVAALGSGARPAGRACVLPGGLGSALVKADCFRIRVPKDKLDAEFLAQYLNTPMMRERVAALTRGATRPRFTLAMLRQIPIPAIPFREQRNLAAELRRTLESIELLRNPIVAQLALAEKLPASLAWRVFDEHAA